LSDLSQLRARLVRIERRGKQLKAELEELKSARLDAIDPLTRTEERRILRLEHEITDARKDWESVWAKVRAEERRLIADPVAFLRFS
jgi:predicted  nucleic acid-binding Zn-ribbon protein